MGWERTVERWRRFEELGFDSVWDCDHWIQPSRPTGPYFEAWTLLAALAARSERIRVGVLVSSNTFRHPAWLAKQAATVDHISNGRLELGFGAGWYVPEHKMLGIPFPEPRELVDRFEEAVEIIDLLLRQEVTSFTGHHYQLSEAAFRPGPVQQPRPPLTLGAHGPRMLGIVARKYAHRIPFILKFNHNEFLTYPNTFDQIRLCLEGQFTNFVLTRAWCVPVPGDGREIEDRWSTISTFAWKGRLSNPHHVTALSISAQLMLRASPRSKRDFRGNSMA